MKTILAPILLAFLATTIAISITFVVGGSIGFPTDIDFSQERDRYLRDSDMLEARPVSEEESDAVQAELARRYQDRRFDQTLATDLRSILIHHALLFGLITAAVFLAFRLSLHATWLVCLALVCLWFWAAPVTAVCYFVGYLLHLGARRIRKFLI